MCEAGIFVYLRMETRVNLKTDKLEVKFQPEGLPAIWVSILCDRCEPFKECLGFKDIPEPEWHYLNIIISNSSETKCQFEQQIVSGES